MPLEPAGLTAYLNWNNVGNSMMMLTVAATGEDCWLDGWMAGSLNGWLVL